MGESAKSFEAINHLDEKFVLSDLKGKKIWLAFYRYASCPLCNLHIHNIIKRFDEVKNLGGIFIPVFQSAPSEVRKYAGKGDLPFQIICDPNEDIYKLYQVGNSYAGFFSPSVMSKGLKAMLSGFMPGKMEGEISRLPSEFIINEEFEIVYRYDGKDIGDHPDIDFILEKLSDKA
ncbi:redoxin domain-containing protein [Halobacteriovorax sp.]|uniref:redoxin domain-containing protein n=1 Tax=Halobacteriovorax sp. TaxID=2020862 RepID=UPI003AF20586